MRAVANSSVLIALSMIEQLALLPGRFPSGILIPLNLHPLGTVGILVWGKRIGAVGSLKAQLDILQTRGRFRLSQSVYEQALHVVGESDQ